MLAHSSGGTIIDRLRKVSYAERVMLPMCLYMRLKQETIKTWSTCVDLKLAGLFFTGTRFPPSLSEYI